MLVGGDDSVGPGALYRAKVILTGQRKRPSRLRGMVGRGPHHLGN